MTVNYERCAAEAVRTALHLRTRYLIAEQDMPSICAALARVMDSEYQRGYQQGYDRGMAEREDEIDPMEEEGLPL